MEPATPPLQKTWEERFVETVIARCSEDKGLAARLRRADNPATEYQSWALLASLGIDLEKSWHRLPHVTLVAAIAKAKTTTNGTLTLGQAVAACYEYDRENSQATTRLRRLLACNDLPELCRVLRGQFSLIETRIGRPLNFVRLLGQIKRFSYDDARNQVKAEWAQEFYRAVPNEQENGDTA